MAYENIDRVAMPNSYPTKAKGKRKRRPFSLKSRKRFDPPLFIPKSQLPKKLQSSSYAQIANPYRAMAMKENAHMKATTARGNDGMQIVW